jgi:hypothetical protein
MLVEAISKPSIAFNVEVKQNGQPLEYADILRIDHFVKPNRLGAGWGKTPL